MDPNKALSDLLDWADENADTDETAQLFLSLNDWLSKGGFLPDRWKRPVAAKTQEPHVPPVLATPAEAFAYRRPAAQLRQALHEINQSLHEAEEALHDARTILNIKLPHR